jgi:hypothetical protein
MQYCSIAGAILQQYQQQWRRLMTDKPLHILEQWEIDAGIWYDEDGNPNCGYREEAAHA